MKNSLNRKSRKLDSAGAARSWLELGIQPVPLRAGTKIPSGGDGWNKVIVKERTLDRHFRPGANIGGLWGEPSGGIVDIDLDWDEAAHFAAFYLPETFTYGRASRPRTHYLYRCKGIASMAKAIPKKVDPENHGKVVEIRSTGTQSVLPPSMHPDRERYEINDDRDFTSIGRGELERLVNRISAAAVLLRHFPNEGGRHDFIHALTGALLWSGWEEDETIRFMEAFLSATMREDDEPGDRALTVKNTIQHFRSKDRVAGWKSLSDWVDPKITTILKGWLAPLKSMTAVPKILDPESKLLIPPFDKKFLEVPGMVGEITRWAGKRSYLAQPSFDLAVGLMCTALASSNHYIVGEWATPLQPYFMMLAPTAAGKGSALESVYEFSTHANLQGSVFQGFQSYYALLDKLGEPPGMACWLWDEAARRLKATKNPSSFDYQIITWLLALYGRAHSHVPSFPGRKTEIPALDRPWLGLMAAAQPDQLIDSVSVSDLAAGLINRFILFDSGDAPPKAIQGRADVFPSSIGRKIKELKENTPPGNSKAHEIGFEKGVWERFRDFDEDSRRSAAGEGDNEIWGRANQNSLILAGIVAVGCQTKKPKITMEVADWAIGLVTWGISCWSARLGESTSRTFRERESKTVEKYIRSPQKYIHRAPPKYKDFLRRGIMPYSVLAKLCRHLQAREFSEILEQLTEAQLIAAGEEDQVECYWGIV